MEVELTSVLVQLKVLREYIVKLGPSRRKGSNFELKISEAKALYNQFKLIIANAHKFSEELAQLITKIEELYKNIIAFDIPVEMASEKFSLKTAVSLLPKMNGDEQVTLDLIDAIQLYDSMLGKSDSELLIKFVLTTRLNQGAKMRLASSYSAVDILIADMKKYLLTTKSDVAIQAKLARVRQNDKSITEFGAEIEKLMIDLTIAQAGENQEAYKILAPLNEKLAVKKFADGLRNQRLSTIVTARDLTSLKDAIRVAEDENCASSGSQCMTFQRHYKPFKHFRNNRYSHINSQNKTAVNRTFRQDKNANAMHSGNMRGRAIKNNAYRGARSQQNRRHVAYIQQTSDDRDLDVMSSSQSGEGQFFRD